MKKNLATYC